jgi:hypothetical protein
VAALTMGCCVPTWVNNSEHNVAATALAVCLLTSNILHLSICSFISLWRLFREVANCGVGSFFAMFGNVLLASAE